MLFGNILDAEADLQRQKTKDKRFAKADLQKVLQNDKGGNTRNLAKHLKDRHPDLFKDLKEEMLHSTLVSVQLLSLMKNQVAYAAAM